MLGHESLSPEMRFNFYSGTGGSLLASTSDQNPMVRSGFIYWNLLEYKCVLVFVLHSCKSILFVRDILNQ